MANGGARFEPAVDAIRAISGKHGGEHGRADDYTAAPNDRFGDTVEKKEFAGILEQR
jgi:hypothetical protein